MLPNPNPNPNRINNKLTAKQLELIIHIAKNYPNFIPPFVVSFLLDAVEFSTDVIFWMTIQPHIGLMSPEARWAQIRYLFPTHNRMTVLPSTVRTQHPLDTHGNIIPVLFPPLTTEALRHTLCFYKFDDKIITALVDTAKNMTTITSWRLTYEAQLRQEALYIQQNKHKLAAQPLPPPIQTPMILSTEDIDHFTPTWMDTRSSHPPVPTHSSSPAVPQEHSPPDPHPQMDPVIVHDTGPHQPTVQDPEVIQADESVHEVANPPDSNALHERPSSPGTPPIPPLDADELALLNNPQRRLHRTSSPTVEPVAETIDPETRKKQASLQRLQREAQRLQDQLRQVTQAKRSLEQQQASANKRKKT